ncbi:MAG: ash family protein [Vibrio sp.]|nr:ash family protein [Vibrio sp.]
MVNTLLYKNLIFDQLIGLCVESVDSSEPQRYPAKALAKSSVGLRTPPYCTRHIVVNQSFGFHYVCLSAPVENGCVSFLNNPVGITVSWARQPSGWPFRVRGSTNLVQFTTLCYGVSVW